MNNMTIADYIRTPQPNHALDLHVRVAFRNELRVAREAIQANAEDFDAVVRVIEKIGRHLLDPPKRGKAKGLGDYKNELLGLVRANGGDATRFTVVFEYVREGRNNAIHTGAVARNLASHCQELAIVLEEVLAQTFSRVADYMVASVLWAADWHLISSVKQVLLANSFSYLPLKRENEIVWISDEALAKYLRSGDRQRELLSATVGEALSDKLAVTRAGFVHAGDPIEAAVAKLQHGRPLLVVINRNGGDEVVGIITAYDLL